MERYLRQCLDSLLVEENFDLLEALVVNDGSKDSTLDIAKEYETKYPHVFKVIDKPNGNYGSCVNRGLKEATGRYVKVLDADDSFDTRGLEKLLESLAHTEADLVLSDFTKVSNVGTVIGKYHFDLPAEGVQRMEDVCNEASFMKMQMHAVTYRLQMLRDTHYRQTEGLSYTDQQWIFMPMQAVRKVCYLPISVYRYLLGREGQTVNADVIKYVTHLIPCMRDIIMFYEEARLSITPQLNAYYEQAILIPMTKCIYVELLLNGSGKARKILRDFDVQLSSWSKYVYGLIGSKEVSSFLGFEYIRYWREHPQLPSWIMKAFGSLYVKAVQLKKKR